MANSSLVKYKRLSPCNYGKRTVAIDRISPHCVVGQASVETLGNIFANRSYAASSNYGIGVDGRVGMYVEENTVSWCTSSYANDNRAVTIECASDAFHPYAMNGTVYATLVNLCVDICRRNGKTKLLWFNDKTKTLNYIPKADEMVITVHRWFANKSCPGDWLYSRLGTLAMDVTKTLAKPTETKQTEQTVAKYRVQCGAFKHKGNAEILVVRLKKAGQETLIVHTDGLYKVQTGAFAKKTNADALQKKLKAAGFDAVIKETK